jgi:DNA helicase HerA-like ATPase
VDKVEQVVRLIRSKGVGVYFVTQNPLDLPDTVLGQLGNRVQHALRAFTPRDQKAVKAAAETFRANPKLDVAEAIQQLGVGEALVSTLGEGGIPAVVERARVRPPRGRIGAISPDERKQVIARSPVGAKYDTAVDRESAYEKLTQRTQATAAPAPGSSGDADWQKQADAAWGHPQAAPAGRKPAAPPPSQTQVILEAAAKSVVRSVGSQVGRELGRELIRGLLGSISKR